MSLQCHVGPERKFLVRRLSFKLMALLTCHWEAAYLQPREEQLPRSVPKVMQVCWLRGRSLVNETQHLCCISPAGWMPLPWFKLALFSLTTSPGSSMGALYPSFPSCLTSQGLVYHTVAAGASLAHLIQTSFLCLNNFYLAFGIWEGAFVHAQE